MVVTNQARCKIGVTFGETTGPPGGKALYFNSDLVIKNRVSEKLKRKGMEDPIGVEIEFVVKKSRQCPPFRKGRYRIFFLSGKVNDHECWKWMLQRYNLASASNGVKVQGIDDKIGSSIAEFHREIGQNKELRDYLCGLLHTAMFTDTGEEVEAEAIVDGEDTELKALLGMEEEIQDEVEEV